MSLIFFIRQTTLPIPAPWHDANPRRARCLPETGKMPTQYGHDAKPETGKMPTRVLYIKKEY